MDFYFDREGNPISIEEWMAKHEKTGGSISEQILRTERGDVLVSTVFTGLNMAPLNPRPMIYETMIFGGEHDQSQWRYSTEDEAKAGHEEACKLVWGEIHG